MITGVVGSIVDVQIGRAPLPPINQALVIDGGDGQGIVLEVQQHLNKSTVRCVAMGDTEGLSCGRAVRDMGGPIMVRHHRIAEQVRRLIEHYRELQEIISLLGMGELSTEDRSAVQRARHLVRFFHAALCRHRPVRGRSGCFGIDGRYPLGLRGDPPR
jgi:F0F1-type ATP synthase beta subunit